MNQFHIPDYRLFRKDRNKNGGGPTCYINQDARVKVVTSYKLPINLEVLRIEITLGKRKIMLPGLYRPPSYSNNEFLFHLENTLSRYTTINKNTTLIEDFNVNPDKNKFFNCLNETFNPKILPKEHICFNSQNPSMIDLVLTNRRSNFMKTAVLETGISILLIMIFSVLKYTFDKGKTLIKKR